VGIDRFVAAALQLNLKNPIEKEEWQEEGYQ